jgi:hypothetical protein
MFNALKQNSLTSRVSSRRSSLDHSSYESAISEETFSSFSDDSDSDRRRRKRRKAVTTRKPRTHKKVAGPKGRDTTVGVKRTGDRKAVSEAKPPARKKEPSPPSFEEIVKISKKEGTTKFQQMRKFLEKANAVEKPPDILAGFLASRRTGSPSRISTGSFGSPRNEGFHTGLTPSSSSRRLPSPTIISRDSEDGFAASDLLSAEGTAVEHKIGSFLHGQRSLNLRSKSKAVGAGDNVHLAALLIEDIPDIDDKLKAVSRAEMRAKILANTADDEDEKENLSSLDDSQIAEFDLVAGL